MEERKCAANAFIDHEFPKKLPAASTVAQSGPQLDAGTGTVLGTRELEDWLEEFWAPSGVSGELRQELQLELVSERLSVTKLTVVESHYPSGTDDKGRVELPQHSH